MSRISVKNKSNQPIREMYSAFSRINGSHPLKKSIPNIYVPYNAFHRPDAEVAYFNFELAKEMGLIEESHPHNLNSQLKRKLLDTFSLRIINEFDLLNETHISDELKCNNQFMATRYLQMQHHNKSGMTSGDGRSIWNGHFKKRGHWDISSCGTGATRLSPASASKKVFFQTADPTVSYGCGLADYSEGIIAAIFSDIMHKNGVGTERTLAVIRYKDGTAINVRAAKNLLRPAHFFGFLKRNDFDALKNLVDYCVLREQENGRLPPFETESEKYHQLLNVITKNFATAAAVYESEYIFCWMDWDGDNILLDGAILDYGTVRQFGMFHHEYRYDDVERYSTSITEQRKKAKLTVQIFAQLFDYLQTGEKKDLKTFKTHYALQYFDDVFEEVILKRLLGKIGFTKKQQDLLFSHVESKAILKKFRKIFRFFEKAVSLRKAYEVADGVTRDAIFCMRDFLREFPVFFLKENRIFTPQEFVDLVSSNYSSQRDKSRYRNKEREIAQLQKLYLDLVRIGASLESNHEKDLLKQLVKRSSVINPYNKVTGDALINIAQRITRIHSQLSFSEMQALIHILVNEHVYDPDFTTKYGGRFYKKTEKIRKLVAWAKKTVTNNREGI